MSSFHGICSCPHGSTSSIFLFISLAAATVCSCYSIASCRLVTLSFDSDLGHFEDHFVQNEASATSQQYQVGVGLFTWLRPSFYVDGDDDAVTRAQVGNWREGSCVGYNTLQLEQGMDTIWEATRILGVFSVLISLSIFLFSLMLSCLAVANWQRYLLTMSCVAVAVVNGCVLLMMQSELCTDFGGGESSCELDQGALVAIAAVILWICSAMLSFFFLEPVFDPSVAQKRSESRKSKKKQSALKAMRKENKVDWNKKSSKKSSKSKSKKDSSTPKTVYESHSIGSPKYDIETPQEDESARAVKQSKRQSSSKQRAIAASPTLHDSEEDVVRKSSFQRGFEKRHYEEKKDPYEDYKKDASEEDYDCISLESLTRSQKRRSDRSGSTAGEILIDLRGADASNLNNKSSAPRQSPALQSNRPTGNNEQRTERQSSSAAVASNDVQQRGSIMQEMERVMFFTDVPCAAPVALSRTRQKSVHSALEEDMELQQSSGPFCGDAGCFR